MARFVLILVVSLLVCPAVVVRADIKETVFFSTQKAGKVPFEHELHLQKLENNCSACHNAIFHVVRKKNPVYTMAEMGEGKSCGACHNKDHPTRLQLSECTKCHPAGDIPITIPDFGTLVFSHGKHLGMFTCTDCHDALFKSSRNNPHLTMAQMEKGKGCGSCHDGKTAFSVKGDCVKCHQPPDVTMSGDSLFSHSLHLGMSFGCNDCHNKLFIPGPNRKHYTMVDMEKGLSCGACHDGKTAFSVKGDCQKCHKNVRNIEFKAFNARYSHANHTKLFGCGDCHSAIFVGGTRSVRYTMPQMEKGNSCGACHDGKTAFGVTGSCDKCHPGTPADITFKIKDAGVVGFSHGKHRDMFACGDCHNAILSTGVAARRFSMAEMEKGSSCGACHDGKTAFGVKSDCGKCHPVKEILFADDARFSHDRHLGMYSCGDCHSKIYRAGQENRRHTMAEMEKGASCGGCHDASTAFSVKGDCDRCHKSTVTITFNVKETGATFFSHTKHTALFKCNDCHSGIFVAGKGARRFKMADMEKGESCGACHDGKTAFGVKDSCVRCHPVKRINFSPGSAVFDHTVHIAAYGCKDCHPAIFVPRSGANKHASMEMMEKGMSCGTCHDGSTAFSVKGDCAKCHPGNLVRIRYELPPATGNVEFSHKLHTEKGYACNSCHYSVVGSGTAGKRWVMKEMDQGKFCGTCHGFSMAFSVKDPMACERCHQREENWKPQQLQQHE